MQLINKDYNKELKNNRINLSELLKINKTVIYALLLYFCGLIFGTVIYYKFRSEALEALIINNYPDMFFKQFLFYLSRYLLLYSISVLLGICLIGFSLINLIPFTLGFNISLKIAYYYLNFGIKGFGYALLMLAPFACMVSTIIIFTIIKSFDLSKKIYILTIKKDFENTQINYKAHLKSCFIYGLLISITALLNAVATAALSGIIVI